MVKDQNIEKFEKLWIEKISDSVVIRQLDQILDEYMDRGISSERLLFTLVYVIKNKYNLRYPAGFRYYIDREEIKNAYLKKKQAEAISKSNRDFENSIKANKNTTDETPKFKVPKRKKIGDLF